MNLNPWVSRKEFKELDSRFQALQERVKELHHIILQLRSPSVTASNIEQPLDEDQQKLVEMLLKNKNLRPLVERGFHSGGLINRRAEGRFGEQTSDQVRASDSPPPTKEQ